MSFDQYKFRVVSFLLDTIACRRFSSFHPTCTSVSLVVVSNESRSVHESKTSRIVFRVVGYLCSTDTLQKLKICHEGVLVQIVSHVVFERRLCQLTETCVISRSPLTRTIMSSSVDDERLSYSPSKTTISLIRRFPPSQKSRSSIVTRQT